MIKRPLGMILRAAQMFSRQAPRLDALELERFVRSFLERRDVFLSTVREAGSPLYAIDSAALLDRAQKFRRAFSSTLPDLRVYYALKSNSHPTIVAQLVQEGLGLDVSSGLELKAALCSDAKDIVFSGPGKRPDELSLAVDNAERVTVLMDSFGELAQLREILCQSRTAVRAGVRLTTDDSGIWKKFGIPLARLSDFFKEAESCRGINLCGLQFHISWNLDPKSQAAFIARLGTELKGLDKKYRKMIEFIDIGGGFWPEQGEWLQQAATPRGMLGTALGDTTVKGLEHYHLAACSISDFADHISSSLRDELPQDVKGTICLEPGRWLCHDAMHILLTVTDVKASDVVITDGGTNAIGWDRFESDYFPVINLTHPSLQEHECLVAGSLCTPHDIWGYSYFGDRIDVGDVLLVPNQGAYTYSLRQEFIKPLPHCVELSTTDRACLTVALN